MFDVNDDAKASYRRVEVLTGPGRRRQWSDEEKARILAETRVAGASVSAVARRWQVCPQQVFGWRRQARLDGGGQLPPHERFETVFVPIVTDVVQDSVTGVGRDRGEAGRGGGACGVR